ncbi:hypothetical protein ON010_g2518 [Phytophthora cinnamomi]|nr:hypothetical protein ON010_g2518 [Phytophthora cinnamomi]
MPQVPGACQHAERVTGERIRLPGGEAVRERQRGCGHDEAHGRVPARRDQDFRAGAEPEPGGYHGRPLHQALHRQSAANNSEQGAAQDRQALPHHGHPIYRARAEWHFTGGGGVFAIFTCAGQENRSTHRPGSSYARAFGS